MASMREPKTLRGLISVPGFRVKSKLTGVPGDRHARVVHLQRQKKVVSVRAAGFGVTADMTERPAMFATWGLGDGGSISSLNGGASTASGVRRCTWKD